MNMRLSFPPGSPGPLVLVVTALAAAFGWSLSISPWLSLLFAAGLCLAGWRARDSFRGAAEFAGRLARSVELVDSEAFRRPVSAGAPAQLDRIAAALAEKNIELTASTRENRRNALIVQAAFAAVDDPLLMVDGQRRVLLINEAAARAFQVDSSEAAGRRFLQVVLEHEIDDALAHALEQGVPQALELDVTTSTPPGRYQVRIQPLAAGGSADASPSGAVVAMRDVTRLRHLERVRSEFVANVSHELRTPITSIKGFIEVLAAEEVPPEKRARFMAILKSEADRLDSLLTDLLDLSLLESDTRPLKREEVDLAQLAARVVMLLEPQAHRKEIRIAVSMARDLPRVPAHPGMLEQALVNLVDNAIKYSPEGSEVAIEGKRVGRDHVEIAVIDNGPGIPSEHLPRLFERFYRVDKARSRSLGGTGLGLAIVRHIVQRHGGAVRAESRLGKGSRFIITLPVEAEEAPVPPWET